MNLNGPRIAVVLLAVTIAAPASARLFIVNETADNADSNPGDGVCAVPFSGNCSLRAAVQEANAWSGLDGILLPAGYFALARTGTDEDNALTGDLDILDDVFILGAGWDKTVISGAFIDRVFDIFAASVDISRVQVRYGLVPELGGGIRANDGTVMVLTKVSVFGNLAGGGAGLYVQSSTTTLDSSEVAYNYTPSNGRGGGIETLGGALTVRRSSIHDNGADTGGGIFQWGDPSSPIATLLVENSTIAHNSPNGVVSDTGGGLTSMRFWGATISDNGLQGVSNGPGLSPELTCTIVSGHTSADCASAATPPLMNGGYNLSQDGSCSDVATDLTGNPLLGPLLGGIERPAASAPRVGSPAIDRGHNSICPTIDQHGRSRPRDGDRNGTATSDIGALEQVLLFFDGLETGNLSQWSSSVP